MGVRGDGMSREVATVRAFEEQRSWVAAGGHRERAPSEPEATQLLLSVHKLTEEYDGDRPTVREIQEELGWSSPSIVDYWLKKCAIRGHLSWRPHRVRTIKLIGEAARVVPELARQRDVARSLDLVEAS